MLKRRTALVALAICVALTVDSSGRSQRPFPSKRKTGQPQQSQPQPTQQPPAADQRGTENSPFIVKVQPSPKTQAQTNQEANDRLEQTTYSRNIVVLNALLVVVAFLQFVAISIQARFLWLAFGAAKKSADVAERALVEIERALVVPTKFQSNVMVRNGQIIAYLVTVMFENTGTTVAKRFTGTANSVMWDGPLPDNFKYPDRTEAAPPNAYVGPRVPVPYPIAIAIQDFIDIMNKKKRGFVYGWVEYNDIFKDTTRRTEFCTEIGIVGDPMIR